MFPSRWKTAKVTPLHKGGDLDDVSNFRPISVLPVLSKVIERHIHDALYNYLTDNSLIYPRQSGFRKRHGTETALIRIIDELLFKLYGNKVCGLVLVDYCKAFDMVDHAILHDKLNAYGVDGSSLAWFKSYLSDRRQLVSLAGTMSDMTTVRHGVPQARGGGGTPIYGLYRYVPRDRVCFLRFSVLK